MKYNKLKELVEKLPLTKTAQEYWKVQKEIEDLLRSMSFNDTRTPMPQRNVEQNQTADKELFREVKGNYYSPSLHVTIDGLIGIDVGGSVHVMSLREWHERAESFIVKTETIAQQQLPGSPDGSPKSCPECDGNGTSNWNRCSYCNGNGQIFR